MPTDESSRGAQPNVGSTDDDDSDNSDDSGSDDDDDSESQRKEGTVSVDCWEMKRLLTKALQLFFTDCVLLLHVLLENRKTLRYRIH